MIENRGRKSSHAQNIPGTKRKTISVLGGNLRPPLPSAVYLCSSLINISSVFHISYNICRHTYNNNKDNIQIQDRKGVFSVSSLKLDLLKKHDTKHIDEA